MENELQRLPYTLEKLPAELRDAKLWLVWRLEDSEKRDRCKVPKIPANLSVGASSTNPEHWTTLTEAQAALAKLKPLPKYAADYSTGVGCVVANGFVGVDLDHCYDEPSATLDEFAIQFLASIPPTYTELTPSRSGLHLWYRLAVGVTPPAKQGIRTKRAELYLSGRYLTMTGWRNGDLQNIHELTQPELDALIAAVEATRETKTATTPVRTYSSDKFNDYMTRHDFADLSAVVHSLVVMLLRKHKLDRTAADAEFKNSAIYQNTHWKEKWERLGKAELDKCEPLAKEWLERDARRAAFNPADGFSHKAAATRFLELNATDWRYVWTEKLWRKWDGSRWRLDKKRQVLLKMDEVAADLLDEAKEASQERCKSLLKFAQSLYHCDNRAKSVTFAQSDSRVSTILEEFDLSPWLFNCANGTYDLERNEFREARRDDLLTKCSPVAYDATALCPLFDKFLVRALPDEAVRNFLQEFAGYTLSGVSYLKFFLLLRGDRDTGKTTVIEVFRHIYGDYAAALSFKGLAPHEGQNAPEVVALRGSRYATAVESQQNQRLDTAQLKLLTGGRDRIKAAEKFQNPVEFDATHKIWLASNWPPLLDSNDDALWRRLLEVPFLITIPLHEQDGKLPDKLKAESSGILNWMIAGWQRVSSRTPLSLAVPEAVKVATEKLRDETDPIREWFDAHCSITDSASDRLYMRAAFESFSRCSKGKFGYTARGFTDHLVKRILCRPLDDKDGKRGSYFVKVRLNELQSQPF